MIRGKVSFESKDIGDWVLVKANGIPTYNYAVVIDDHCMDITHVFRGEEHLSNTPKQIMLYKMFGWDVPLGAFFENNGLYQCRSVPTYSPVDAFYICFDYRFFDCLSFKSNKNR